MNEEWEDGKKRRDEKIDGERKNRGMMNEKKMNILIEYKYVYPSTDKYRMNIGKERR